MDYKLIIPLIFLGFALAEIISSRFFSQPHEEKGDKWVEIISTLMLTGVTQPFILVSAMYLSEQVAPTYAGSLAELTIGFKILILLIGDDMMQYWWHRASHTFPFLYGLHRAHHNGNYMSIRIVYRNNILYYSLMPSLWISGVLIYLGLGDIYIYYVVLKMSVIFGAHSNVRWDKPFIEHAWLSPIYWVLERTISTPATHAAHHGKYADDPATNYKGNFGNLLFFWDILFGTAKITRTYPIEYGVENLAPMSAKAQLLWPILQDETSPAEEITPAEPPKTSNAAAE